jgi:hypothetical protein
MCINRSSHYSSKFYSLHKFWKKLPLLHGIHRLLYKYTIYTVLYIEIHKFTRDIFRSRHIFAYRLRFGVVLLYHSDKGLYD